MSAAELLPARDVLAAFSSAIFKYADPQGIGSLRAFPDEKGQAPAIFIEPIAIGDPQFLNVAYERARQAANWHKPAVFCPPIATFKTTKDAKATNVFEGLVLSVECDKAPTEASATLSAILGEPTIIAASGGEWQDPETGEIEPKLHLHWRLKTPTRSVSEHAQLIELRTIACGLVGADASANPIVHPMRWSGSWHRKTHPRIASILSQSENEIELLHALAKMRELAGRGEAPPNPENNLKAEQPEDIARALAAIPNDNLEWTEWNYIGMAVWGASGGSGVGRNAFAQWSSKAKKNDPAATEDRWKHYERSSPSRLGFGTLVYLARKHSPGWALNNTETIDPVDLWGNFDPPSPPQGYCRT